MTFDQGFRTAENEQLENEPYTCIERGQNRFRKYAFCFNFLNQKAVCCLCLLLLREGKWVKTFLGEYKGAKSFFFQREKGGKTFFTGQKSQKTRPMYLVNFDQFLMNK